MSKQTSNMVRRLLMAVMVMAAALQARAASAEKLTFTVNGEKVEIILAEHPVITYTNNTLHVKTDTETIEIPVSEISGGSFDNPTGIQTLEMADMENRNGEIRFSHLKPGSPVEVFSFDGVKLSTTTADGEGKAVVSAGQLPKGAYIVRTASQTIKIVNK